MTNSEQPKHRELTGTEAPTSQEPAEYVSNKGTEFKLVQLPNGFWIIRMLAGGKKPSICDEKFTGPTLAHNELVKYLAKNDRLGYAVYPNKDE